MKRAKVDALALLHLKLTKQGIERLQVYRNNGLSVASQQTFEQVAAEADEDGFFIVTLPAFIELFSPYPNAGVGTHYERYIEIDPAYIMMPAESKKKASAKAQA